MSSILHQPLCMLILCMLSSMFALKGHCTCVVSGGNGSECACVVGLLCVLAMQINYTVLCVPSMAFGFVGL